MRRGPFPELSGSQIPARDPLLAGESRKVLAETRNSAKTPAPSGVRAFSLEFRHAWFLEPCPS